MAFGANTDSLVRFVLGGILPRRSVVYLFSKMLSANLAGCISG
jgi:hypothetical protein